MLQEYNNKEVYYIYIYIYYTVSHVLTIRISYVTIATLKRILHVWIINYKPIDYSNVIKLLNIRVVKYSCVGILRFFFFFFIIRRCSLKCFIYIKRWFRLVILFFRHNESCKIFLWTFFFIILPFFLVFLLRYISKILKASIKAGNNVNGKLKWTIVNRTRLFADGI